MKPIPTKGEFAYWFLKLVLATGLTVGIAVLAFVYR